ncbi:hypothetical protein C0989_007585 [Termitomyces sp. Mn162]|nr:hypothetical protein C0989_007585 [Termitomyces sp. Mn162]
MAPIRTQWTRLIRFVANETSRVHIGQPVDEALDVGLAAYQRKLIKAFEISGSALDPAAQVTTKVLTVKSLLTPLSREEVKLVRCLGLNYVDHAEEARLPKPNFPVLFYKPVTSLIGPLAPVIIPKVAQPPKDHNPDYEVELVIVIGRAAKNVSEADALDYVLAYSGANDVRLPPPCIRTILVLTRPLGLLSQTSDGRLSMGLLQIIWSVSGVKDATALCSNFSTDNTNPFGPCLVSSRLIPDPQRVSLKATVNGSLLQDGNTAEQIFGVRRTVAFLSQGTTLEPGTIILTGTPKGVGFVKSPPLYLKHGDKMSVWLSNGIGTLYNDVVEEERSTSQTKL